MKKLLSVFMILLLCSVSVFADEEQGDEYDDGYVYTSNGAGDRLFRVELAGFFPIAFDNQVYVGGDVSVSFFRFVNSTFAIGGDITISNNFTIGNKPLILIPINFAVMYQPTINKLEFPIVLSVGTAIHTMASASYFPGLSVKGSVGAFYRLTESWSCGLTGSFYWLPEWFKDSSKNDNACFASAGINIRFHF